MKKIILIIAGIVVVGIGGYLFLKKFVPPLKLKPSTETVGKCGDNICDEFEKANSNACPADCVVKNTENIVAGSIGGYLFLKKFVPPLKLKPSTETVGKCGDNICDEFEKANSNACPADCVVKNTENKDKKSSKCPQYAPPAPSFYKNCEKKGGSVKVGGKNNKGCQTPPQCVLLEKTSGATKSSKSSSKSSASSFSGGNSSSISSSSSITKSTESPFGIGISNKQDVVYVKDLNFKSVRLAGISGVIWDLIKSQGYGQLDSVVSEAYKNNLEIFVVVLAGNPTEENKLNEYSSFVSSLVERYDGDGKNDAPGSPIVTYWEIDNEPDFYEGSGEKTSWKGELSETADYAKVLQAAYKAAKSANSNAKLTIAGMASNLNYYESIFKELEKIKVNSTDRFFDAFNFHYYGSFDDYGAIKVSVSTTTEGVNQPSFSFEEVKDLLGKYGYSNYNVMLTETGTVIDSKTENTEQAQAISLIKKYVYPISHGVGNRVHWLNIKASGDGPFDKLSLISTDSIKRLQYFSFKLLIEKLNGFDWGNIQTIQEKDGVYVYKFTKNSKPIWVAWNDNDAEKQVTISGIDSSSVKITEAVPNYSSGKEVTNYNTAFSTKIASAENRKATLKIKDIPVFVEEN